eukprot:tig00000459_g1087.t1
MSILGTMAAHAKKSPELLALWFPVTVGCGVAVYTMGMKLFADQSNDVCVKKEHGNAHNFFARGVKFENVAPMKMWATYGSTSLGVMSAIPEELREENKAPLRAAAAARRASSA